MPYNTRRAARGRSTYTNSYSSGGRSAKRGPRKENIHPSRFIKAATQVEIVPYIPTHTFAEFMVDDKIKQNIINKGYVTPSPIQDQAIPIALEGRDVVGIANTGTGKTAAFAIPILHSLVRLPKSKALIMAPTRELAEQIEAECRELGRGAGFTGALLIGGTAMGPQLRDLRANPRIVIGTPGRIKDHMERGTLILSDFDIAVLDEVDRMLDMGFVNDMRAILAELSSPRQSLFFSATLSPAVRSLITTFSHDPVTISVKTGDTVDSVEQDVVKYISKTEKIEKLHDTLNQDVVEKVVVFDDTQRSVERLSVELEARGFKVDAIHGGKSQSQRQRALRRFKKSEVNILVATDVAARGIDVADITHVINYSQPQSYDDYVHRIGRAGRAGRTGYALTFIEGY
jgi:superfamily II DNA/RNA helicase